MQSPLPQFLFLKGSDLASLLTEFPALSITRTSIPMEIPKSLQAAFIFSVSSPAVGSMIKGAETLSALVWCQVVAFLSFSSLRAAFCQLLARWMGRTPLSSSSHIFLNFRNEREDSPLWKHCQLAHNGEKQDFSMEVIGSFQSCLERQINEAVRITSSQADFIMNSKSEFHQAPIVRVVATNGLQSEQGEGWKLSQK